MTKSIREKYPKTYGKYKDWEVQYIQDNWGYKSVHAIANYLQRSPSALIRYSENHKLGGAYISSDLLSVREVADIFNVNESTVRREWTNNFDFPLLKKKYYTRYVYRVNLDDLLKWCETHQDRFSTVNMELYALGQEPDWLTKKRKADYYAKPAKQLWSKESENQLLKYVMQGLSNEEISIKMNRTKASISRKKCRLIKDGRLKEMILIMQNNIQKVGC